MCCHQYVQCVPRKFFIFKIIPRSKVLKTTCLFYDFHSGSVLPFCIWILSILPVTLAVLWRACFFDSRVLPPALSLCVCDIDFLCNRHHCLAPRKCYIIHFFFWLVPLYSLLMRCNYIARGLWTYLIDVSTSDWSAAQCPAWITTSPFSVCQALCLALNPHVSRNTFPFLL